MAGSQRNHGSKTTHSKRGWIDGRGVEMGAHILRFASWIINNRFGALLMRQERRLIKIPFTLAKEKKTFCKKNPLIEFVNEC